jgi:hypothetical protein
MCIGETVFNLLTDLLPFQKFAAALPSINTKRLPSVISDLESKDRIIFSGLIESLSFYMLNALYSRLSEACFGVSSLERFHVNRDGRRS